MAGPSLAIMVIKIATKKMQRYWNQIIPLYCPKNSPLLPLFYNYIIIKLLTLFCEETCLGFVVCSQELGFVRETFVVFGCLSHFVSLVVVVCLYLVIGFFFFDSWILFTFFWLSCKLTHQLLLHPSNMSVS